MIKTGDVVVLKSGGPEMTVEGFEHEGAGRVFVICSWFVGATRERARFLSEALEIVDMHEQEQAS